MKLIFEVRDIWPLTIIELGKKSKHNPFVLILNFIEKLAYKKSNAVIGTMGKLDKHILDMNIHPNYFKFIPQGIDIDFLKMSEKMNIEDQISLPVKKKLVIGYAGSMSISNNLKLIIKAAEIIEKINPDIVFYFLGDGMEKENLINQSKDLKNVYFFKKVNKKYVLSFLKHCDILYDSVNSSIIYDYGISRNKLMDYMYAGKPILFSYDGYDDLISKLSNGYIINPNNLKELVNQIINISKINKEKLDNIGNKGREYVLKNRKFDILAKKYTEAFSK